MGPNLSIICRLLLPFLGVLAAVPTTAEAQLAARARRGVAGPLPLSVANEVAAAASRAQAWLIREQAADGGWGSAERLATTALACLALRAADGDPTPGADARGRGRAWLAARPAEELAAADLAALAWRRLALAETPVGAGADSPEARRLLAAARDGASNRLHWALARLAASNLAPEALPPLPAVAAVAAANATNDLMAACALLASAPPGPAAASLVARLARQWQAQGPPRDAALGATQPPWLLAFLINRVAEGALIVPAARQPATALDWREALAQDLVAAQRIDAHGGGYWPAPGAAAPGACAVRETAFGLLALREL